MNNYNELVLKLKEIFQIDKPELDFGIYRILNARADEINDYLENKLKAKVQAALSEAGNANKEELVAKLDKIIKTYEELEEDPYEKPKVKDLQKQIADLANGVNEHESAVFSHLLTFFSRYYDNGDFISKRRYKGDTYAIPYAGEEVMLHWANKDQYYIKSGENFVNYSFKLDDDRKVNFKLLAADIAKGNLKDNDVERRFVLIEPHSRTKLDEDGKECEVQFQPIEVIKSEDREELVIHFEYKPVKKGTKQETLVQSAVSLILESDVVQTSWAEVAKRAPTEKNPGRTEIERHLTTYTQRNTADYFIHKDLNGFLSNELDFYIKNEVMNLDNIQNANVFSNVEKQLRMIQCFRSTSRDLIQFLAQLENFQKTLWVKKKFVVDSHYLITLDKVPPELYGDILINDTQVNEWVDLFRIDLIEGYSLPLNESFLLENKGLLLDTSHFGERFKAALLNSLDQNDFDKCSLIINSDNFQAINLIQKSYKEKIRTIYIDPPYNTGQDGFNYKDSYKHSSWLSMMNDRLRVAYPLMSQLGTLFCSINEVERHSLEAALNEVFDIENRVEELIWASDTVSNNAPAYSTNHEYIEVYAKNRVAVESERTIFREQRAGYVEVSDLIDSIRQDYPSVEEIQDKLRALYSEHKSSWIEQANLDGIDKDEAIKIDPWKGIYPYRFAEYRNSAGEYVNENEARDVSAEIWVFREVEPSMPSGKQAENIKDPESDNYRFYTPKNPKQGENGKAPKRGWAFPYKASPGRPSFEKYCADNRIVFKGPDTITQLKYFLHEVESVVSTSVIRQYSDGEPKLEAMFDRKGLIQNPKPPALIEKVLRQTTDKDSIIMDFFAGSGTTAQAVIDLNKKDSGNRSFLLIEAGDYCNSVTIPRVKKSFYSSNWKQGIPNDRKLTSGLVKYLHLESYEDTLSNLKLKREGQVNDLFSLLDEDAQSNYLLNYMLETESKGSLLSTNDFKNPFNYKMEIAVNSAGANEEKKVDLVETFNYLIGLQVNSVESNIERGYLRVEGKLSSGERVLVLWRDCDKIGYEELTKYASRFDLYAKEQTFDVIYITGDHNLPTAFTSGDEDGEITRTLKLRQIEPEFLSKMFAEETL